jgi:thiosulfate dehydrogenase
MQNPQLNRSMAALLWLPLLAGLMLACEGPPGDDGAVGPEGPEGPTGPAGEDGANGTNGTNGTDGTDGADGDPCAITDNGDGTYTVSCPGSADVTIPPATPAAYDSADAARGGQLYDKYWNVDGVTATEPTTDHALYPAVGVRTGSTTWRCKECHGWDYVGRDGRYASGSHYTGIPGLFPATLTPEAAFAVIKTDHGYGAAGLTDADIWDLVKFYKEAQYDVSTTLWGGDEINGAALYANGVNGAQACSACHGADGLTDVVLNFDAWPGLLANENPQEMQHKILFGHPGTAMPAAYEDDASLRQVADLMAYLVTLPSDPAYDTADASRGGRLYDKFWNVAGVTAAEPSTTHPAYPTDGPRTGSTTWRCKECHGWDYIGDEGRYASGSHYTGIAGLYPATRTLFDAFDVIKNGHGYGAAGLTDADIWDLVVFYEGGMIDVNYIMGSDGSFNGDTTAGGTLYDSGISTNATCTSCHGADGLTEVVGGFDAFVGLLSNDNPQEFQHKMRFGHPGTAMPAGYDVDASLVNIADLSAYSQTLPCAAGPLYWVDGVCQ